MTEQNTTETMTKEELSEHVLMRKKNLAELKEMGVNPYGQKFERSAHIGGLLEKFAELQESEEGGEVNIAGRLMAFRSHGKASFGDIEDITGRIQVYFKQNKVGAENYQVLKKVDIGDILGVRGKVFRTRRGELTVFVEEFTLLSKAVQPPPEKYHGLKDVEIRYRQRYVDLLSNKEVRDVFINRSKIISTMRNLLESKGFMEVETPSMSSLAGGAMARPFVSHHNALDMKLFFRIAPELFLKRCIVGGLEKVFEIGRVFRNEGIDTRHNPEFTIMELYQAYADYEDMMRITEDIIHACAEALGKLEVELEGNKINLKPPFARMTMAEAYKKYADIDMKRLREIDYAKEVAKKYHLDLERKEDIAYIMDKIFSAAVEPNLVQPTFITDYPIELSPLAKKREDDPTMTYRFELYINTWEVANAFSELNDPVDQRERFMSQVENKQKFDDDEAHPLDEDYITALEYGMPPCGGLGIGVDRLIMILSEKISIRDVILFPLLKPKAE